MESRKNYQFDPQKLDEWSNEANRWLECGSKLEALVTGDIMVDKTVIAESIDDSGRYGCQKSYSYPNDLSKNFSIPGGAGKAFEIIRNFVSATILGITGNDYEGKKLHKILKTIDPKRVFLLLSNRFSTHSIIRIYQPKRGKISSFIKTVRIERLSQDDIKMREIPLTILRNVKTSIGLILIFDHGLGAVTKRFLNGINNRLLYKQHLRKGANLPIIARLKHASYSKYQLMKLNALILDWDHLPISSSEKPPKPSNEILESTRLRQFFTNPFHDFPLCDNIILLCNKGITFLIKRLHGQALSALIYSYNFPANEIPDTLFTNSGHVFTCIFGIALSGKEACQPESAVCLGLIASSAQKLKTPGVLITRDDIKNSFKKDIFSKITVRQLTTINNCNSSIRTDSC